MDYNVLASQEQVLAYFLPEAPAEMLKIFDEVSFTRPCSHGTKFNQIFLKLNVCVCDYVKLQKWVLLHK